MPTVNDFKPYATAGGANVETQGEYLADPALGAGVQIGIADPRLANKVWRQGAFMAAVIGEYIKAALSADVLDDGDLAGKVAQLTSALQDQINASLPFAASFTSAEKTLTALTEVDCGAHGLGGVPSDARLVIRCKTAELGYSVDDEVEVVMMWGLLYFSAGQGATKDSRGIACIANSTHIFANIGAVVTVYRRDTPGVLEDIDMTKWKIVTRAWR